MARREDRHPDTSAGDWFVDTSCIGCDAARRVAPGPRRQYPRWPFGVCSPARRSRIGVASCHGLSYTLGHNAQSSYGAHSYLVQRPAIWERDDYKQRWCQSNLDVFINGIAT